MYNAKNSNGYFLCFAGLSRRSWTNVLNMDSNVKLFCSWVLLMTQPLRLLGNNSGNLSTATIPLFLLYARDPLSKKCHWHFGPLKKGFKVFCIILFTTLSGTGKKGQTSACHCLLMLYFRSKSDIQSFFYESISVLKKKSIFATFPSCIDNSIPAGRHSRQTSTTAFFTKDLWLPDNVTYYSLLVLQRRLRKGAGNKTITMVESGQTISFSDMFLQRNRSFFEVCPCRNRWKSRNRKISYISAI